MKGNFFIPKDFLEYISNYTNPEEVKNHLENLYLYLHEIDAIINSDDYPSDDEEKNNHYKTRLNALEQAIGDIDEYFRQVASQTNLSIKIGMPDDDDDIEHFS